MSEEANNILDLGSIDFTPDWAKKSAGVSVGKGAERFRDDGDKADRPRFNDGKRPFGDRKPMGERKSFGDRKPFGRKPFGDRGGAPMRREERPRPLDVEVKILPETKALGTIIRKLQQDTHAYKLKDLAYFFLDNPQSILLKVTAKASQPSQPSQPSQRFYQCKVCGFASTRDEDVIDHILTAHLGDYYDSKEIETEPPKGNFSCVAKCGLSGVLLGPPNIHEFNSVVREMIRTRYPDMSEEQYRAHIEMVRDADAIEEWRKGATKKTVFFAKGQAEVEGAAQMTREQAEGEFKRTILASLLDQPKHLMITADVAMKSPVKPLVWAAKDAIEAERRAPYNMCFALRGAFHHRKLNFFRANDARGQEFVTSVEYKEFDAAHAIPELAKLATFVAEHPCCDKSELGDDPEAEKHLAWLVSTGHVVAFTNGVYSMVEKYPKYGPQWKKRGGKAAEAKAEKVKAEEVKAEGEGVGVGEEPKPEVVADEKKVESVETVEKVESVETVESVENVEKVENVESVASEEVKEVKDETAPVVAE